MELARFCDFHDLATTVVCFPAMTTASCRSIQWIGTPPFRSAILCIAHSTAGSAPFSIALSVHEETCCSKSAEKVRSTVLRNPRCGRLHSLFCFRRGHGGGLWPRSLLSPSLSPPLFLSPGFVLLQSLALSLQGVSSSTQPEGVRAASAPLADWGCEDKIGAVGQPLGQPPTESPAFQPQHPNTRTHNVPRRLRLGPPYDLAWSSFFQA